MRTVCLSRAAIAGLAIALAVSGLVEVAGQELSRPLQVAATVTSDLPALRRFDALVETLTTGGELVLASSRPDTQLQGRTQQFFQQYHEGVPVYGAGVSRQRADGATVSLLGTIQTGIELDPQPRFQSAKALEMLEQQTGAGALANALPELVILQVPSGRYVLAYRATMRDLRTYFLDAHSGFIAHDESLVREQSVGAGNGILGQRKKLSTSQAGGRYEAYDRLRPAEIITLDLRGNEDHMFDLITREVVWAPSDVASDADNVWSDPAVVDGHAYVGFTYDYLATRQGWRGMDGRDGRIFSMVNIGQDTGNAFFFYPPAGPEGRGVLGFGDEMDGTPVTAADTVAHEFMHAVTHHAVLQRTGAPLLDTYRSVPGPSSFTVDDEVHECGRIYTWTNPIREEWRGRKFRFRCDGDRHLLVANEGGAVNEAWSDMFGTAVEFMVHEPAQGPLRADYEIGEDTPPAVRSLVRPTSKTLQRTAGSLTYPDAARRMIRFLVGEFEDNKTTFFSSYGSVDGENIVSLGFIFYDGVHWNSTVLSHAFYLAIEGGTHATTGLTVPGVGGERRHDIERVFFRAMTELMPPRTNVEMAAKAVRMAALDLFGAGSDVFASVHQALSAVGLGLGENDE